MSAVTRTAEARMRLVRALVRSKSTAAAAAGKPIAHIYPNSETPVKALDPRAAASSELHLLMTTPRKKEGGRLTSGADQNSQIAPLAIEAARRRRRRRPSTRARVHAADDDHTRAPPTRDELTQNDTQARHLRAPPHGPVREGPIGDAQDHRV